ncbi:hypothetical protein TWF730_007484 [Orbilia blumenaviensis]|uniref:Secreted protein n=1 Tax=Orbilia blumenaviensis TaxID=1796055 RepID=A0AAV9VA94_9PEZI
MLRSGLGFRTRSVSTVQALSSVDRSERLTIRAIKIVKVFIALELVFPSGTRTMHRNQHYLKMERLWSTTTLVTGAQ